MLHDIPVPVTHGAGCGGAAGGDSPRWPAEPRSDSHGTGPGKRVTPTGPRSGGAMAARPGRPDRESPPNGCPAAGGPPVQLGQGLKGPGLRGRGAQGSGLTAGAQGGGLRAGRSGQGAHGSRLRAQGRAHGRGTGQGAQGGPRGSGGRGCGRRRGPRAASGRHAAGGLAPGTRPARDLDGRWRGAVQAKTLRPALGASSRGPQSIRFPFGRHRKP